ncbi:MAG: nuclear transport factor 2 family protein [Deltaproteobacteria bacterium]
MDGMPPAETIRKVAEKLDYAINEKDHETILSSFSEDCEIELLGIRLMGREGVVKWVTWMNSHLAEVKLTPVAIMVDGNRLFEDFVLSAKLHTGVQIASKQAQVLIFESAKIKKLRLYFDRIDFADSLVRGFVNRSIVKRLIKKSLQGLN